MLKYINNDNGAALLIVLALMAMLSIVAFMSVDRSTTDIELSYNQLHEDQAFYIAEAGAKQALRELNEDNDWRTGYVREALGDGSFSVEIIDSTIDASLYDTIIVRSTGRVQAAAATVEFENVPEYRHPFKYAMFAEAGISLDRNTCTDSYNSDSGSYVDTYLDSLGSLGTNGTVSTSKDVVIGGDVQTATPGGLSFGVNNTVNGDTTSTMDSVNLDLIPASEFEWAKLTSNALSGISGSGYTYNNATKSLSSGSSGSIELQSGVYYFSSIELEQDSKLTLAPGADVTIYVTGDVVLRQNSTINDGGNPADLIVYSDGGTLQFDQGNTFYGGFYGPNAHIQYDQTTQVFGSLVGNTIQMDKGACFHYDRNLMNLTKGTTGLIYMVAWSESI